MLNSCDHLLQIELGLVFTFIYLLHNVQLLLCILYSFCISTLSYEIIIQSESVIHSYMHNAFTICACCVITSIFSACMITIATIFECRTAALRDGAFGELLLTFWIRLAT